MRIAICGSMAFAERMLEARDALRALGHEAEVPHDAASYASVAIAVEEKWEHAERDFIRDWYAVIGSSDAVLVLNHSKNGIENYVGGNGLIEMAFAHVLHKKVFLLNPVPQMNYADEIRAFGPVVLDGDLSAIA